MDQSGDVSFEKAAISYQLTKILVQKETIEIKIGIDERWLSSGCIQLRQRWGKPRWRADILPREQSESCAD
jgi:hypothetical protein